MRKHLAGIGFTGLHVLRSRLSSPANGTEGEQAQRGLPNGAFSSMALAASLGRWASQTPRRGGLRGDTCSSAALWLLKSLVRGAAPQAERQSARFEVRFVSECRHMWPLSEVSAPDLSLSMSGEGKLDVRPWHAVIQDPRSMAAKVWRDLQRTEVLQICTQSVSVSDLIVASAGVSQLAAFHGQLVLFVASRIEVAAFVSLRKAPTTANSFECQNVNFMDLLLALGPDAVGPRALEVLHGGAGVRKGIAVDILQQRQSKHRWVELAELDLVLRERRRLCGASPGL